MKKLDVSSLFGIRTHPITKKVTFHNGVDFKYLNSYISFSVNDGVIRNIKYSNINYGKYLLIFHNQGYYTLYAHLNRFSYSLKIFKYLKYLYKIGYIGNTGYSTGTHLHYEIRENLVPINPLI